MPLLNVTDHVVYDRTIWNNVIRIYEHDEVNSIEPFSPNRNGRLSFNDRKNDVTSSRITTNDI